MSLDETLRFGYAARDLLQWISPLLVPWREFQPAVEWWKCSYLGFAGCLAAALGFVGLGRRRAAGAAVLLGLALVLILGDANPVSRALWAGFPPLRYVRYPGNLGYLVWPLLALLAAAARLAPRVRGVLFLVLCAELLAYASLSIPLAPRGLFTTAGPLARRLQDGLEGRRYLLSPLALERHAGASVADWKTRLYGVTNDPYRIRAVGNFGEPLVPKASYDFMDLLYSRPGAEAAARLLPWAGARYLLTPGPLPASPSLSDEGATLWRLNRVRDPVALAYWFDERAGAALPVGAPADRPRTGRPVSLVWEREDRYRVAGEQSAPGWVYIAEPRYPGWKAVLETPAGRRAVAPLPAALAFQKVPVPAGPWRLSFRFEPGSWAAGRLATVSVLLALALYWYNSARAMHAS